MNVTNEIPSHFGDVAVARPGPRDMPRFGQLNPITYKVSYINNLSKAVTVVWRSGLRFVLPPQRGMESNKLVVRVEITIDASAAPDIRRQLSAVNDASSSELKALREAFTVKILENTYGGATLILDYPLSLEQLHACGGSVYYHELDSVISLHDHQSAPPHPYSEEGRNLRLIEASDLGLSGIGFGYSVEIIDNNKSYGDRFLNIGNKVYKVAAQKDRDRRDGIYVIANHPTQGEIGREGRDVQYHPFEGAEEKLGIFKSAEDALNLGDASLARKHEIVSLEHNLAKQKIELQETKNAHQKEMLEKETELKRVETERDRQTRIITEMREAAEHSMKMERERAKSYYEDRAYDRKDTNEVLKFLPSIIVGIGAVLMAIKTFAGKAAT